MAQPVTFSSLNGPYGGNLGDIVFTQDGEIFVSAYYSQAKGVFKSKDNGLNWQHLLPSGYTYTDYLAMGINKNDVLFAGTGGGGLYRSTDKGETWESLTEYPGSECWAIAFNDSNHIFAGDGDLGGVFKSVDNGDTWIQVLPNSVAPLAIEINNVGSIFVGTRDNFYKSTDYGISWNSYYAGLDNQIIASILACSISEVFVGTGYYNTGNGVYYSSDGGETWEQKGLEGRIIYSLISDQFGEVYAATKNNGVYKTQDQGLKWRLINEGLKNYNIFRINISPSNILYACSETEGGIYKSYDYGELWEITGVIAGTMRKGFITFSGDIYSATDGGVQKYCSTTEKWTVFGLNEVRHVVIDHDSVLYAGTRWDGVFTSTDNGNTWEPTANIGGLGIELFTMALSPDSSVLVGTNNYIKRSTDQGIFWATIINGLPNATIGNLEVAKNGYVYATSGTNLCRADNIKSTFNIIKDSIYVPARNGLAVGENGLLFLSDSFFDPGIYRSNDYGVTWIKVFERSASSISIFENKYIVTGHDDGEIMFSFDKGDSWTVISDELPQNSIIYWSQIDSFGYLYCAASGFGLFKSNSIVTNINEAAFDELQDFVLYNSYPNPFNSTTHIKYTIPQSGIVTLKVYDILGNEITTLLDGYHELGEYDVIFRPDDLSSGIYFYQLKAGNFVATKKLILLK
jgi:photosystem II stability/assembly factor-like uncharacterized protein